MFRTYRAAFRVPGSGRFAAAGFVARFSIAVYPIGLVLLISLKTGHYGFAGLLSGIYVVSNGAGNSVLGRLVDRFGQSRLLIPATCVHLAAVVTIIALVESNAPHWALVPPTIVIGLSYLPIGSLVRARWSLVLAGQPELTTAYALESTLDEVIFTLGPLLAAVIATQLSAVWVFVVAGLLVGAGAFWLSGQHDTEPRAQEAGAPPHQSALRYRGIVLLILSAVCMGAMFASAEVSIVAFCGQHGQKGLSGVALSCFAGGSAVSGFLYGARHHARPARERFVRQALILGALSWLFLVTVDVPVVAVVAAVVGAGIAPTLISAFGLIESIVPNAALTEGMSWLVTGLSIGYGLASSLVGSIADAHGARVAFTVGIGAGVLVCVLALTLRARLRVSAESEPVAVG
ncbi:MFS transporter [Jatrophihabitans sp.]|uniref:MFS transporter n=1 Tax=Jatrophihabitans sp. TaxID=1932789 RepID=UPI0030C74264|nr:transporter [Jatrophihabitans sp.]